MPHPQYGLRRFEPTGSSRRYRRPAGAEARIRTVRAEGGRSSIPSPRRPRLHGALAGTAAPVTAARPPGPVARLHPGRRLVALVPADGLPQVEHQLRRRLGHLRQRLPHGRQRRAHPARHRQVVEADHAQVLAGCAAPARGRPRRGRAPGGRCRRRRRWAGRGGAAAPGRAGSRPRGGSRRPRSAPGSTGSPAVSSAAR